jgi:kynurenine formamidase
MQFIDLSVPLNEKTPVYPGDPVTKIERGGVLEKDGYEDHSVCVGTHVGTHVDAPSHMIQGGVHLGEIPLSRFFGRGVYVKTGRNLTLDAVKNVSIQQDDIVIFHTGMSDLYYQPDYYEKYPTMTEELAYYLVEKKVKMVGVDMCSPDKEPFPIHRILLKANILILENLTNLSALQGKDFTIWAFPIKLELDGAPTRVVAGFANSFMP